MKRIISLFLVIVFVLCAALSSSAFTPQSALSYQSCDDTGVYVIRCSGAHADIARYSSHTLSAGVNVSSTIHGVCAYRGKVVFFSEDVKNNQLNVYVYYLDTDYLNGFAVNNVHLYDNIDFVCDNNAIYIESSRDNHELSAFSYSGSYLGQYRFDSGINALFGGYHSGIYAVSGNTLYTLSSGSFTALSGDFVEMPLFPADGSVLASGYGTVYIMDGDRVTEAFSVDCDYHASSACVIGNELYFPCGDTINVYDLDTGENTAYYRTSFDVLSVFVSGNDIIVVGDSDHLSVNRNSFTQLHRNDDQDNRGDPSSRSGSNSGSRSSNSVISSDYYQVDFNRYYITGITPGTTVAGFKDHMDYDGYSVALYRENSAKKSGNVGTGMTAVFTGDDGSYTFELSVVGDITGEGSRNSRDLNTLMDYLIGAADFNGVYAAAADLSDDGAVDVCDLAYLKSMI